MLRHWLDCAYFKNFRLALWDRSFLNSSCIACGKLICAYYKKKENTNLQQNSYRMSTTDRISEFFQVVREFRWVQILYDLHALQVRIKRLDLSKATINITALSNPSID